MDAPRAERRPVTRTLHGHTTVDDFSWLRDREDPAVRAYLDAENEYVDATTGHLAPLRATIFEETLSRMEEADLSAPARRGRFWYGQRMLEGCQYPVFVRWADEDGRPAEAEATILDQNELAKGEDFCALGVFRVSPAQDTLAYSVDFAGDERYELRFREIASGVERGDRIPGTYYGGAWSADGSYFYYTTIDAAHRPHRLWRHRLGTDPGLDALVYQEDDERFFLEELRLSRDEQYVLVLLESSTTSEVRYLTAAGPEEPLRVLLPRRAGVRYHADRHRGEWLAVTDDAAPNGRLVTVDPDRGQMTDVIPHDPAVKLGRIVPFEAHLVLMNRRGGNPGITVLPAQAPAFEVGFDEPAYRLGVGENLDYAGVSFRFTYESLLTPRRVIDVALDTGKQTIVKETPAPNYDPAAYVQERLWCQVGATAVPMTLAYHRSTPRPAPVLLYGYGAYESVLDPWFDPALFSLLDRGVVYAIAHVRGGGELGRLWHLDGRMDRKVNTFTDFVACAENLIERGVARHGQVAARGLSAGGLLMGAVTTMRPDLWAAVIAEVPFVDVINTMSDPAIPLTVIEWEEWGNPQLADQHAWLAGYSPYEQTGVADYPAVLATAGLHDPRVAFWEPAKWVAKLRTVNTGSRPILLRTDTGAGHGGPSGRYDALRHEAFLLAFALDQLRPDT